MTDLPSELLERPVEMTARLLALSMLDRARQAYDRLGGPADGEALHDFRVALRRLRTCVKLYRPYAQGAVPPALRRHLRDLAKATNPGRDAEVALGWLQEVEDGLRSGERPGLDRLVGRFEGRKGETQVEEVRRSFRELDGQLREKLGARWSASFAATTGELIRRHAAALDASLAAISSEAQAAQQHQARIRVKRLRYLLEPIAGELEGGKALVRRLEQLQDVLGDLHDTHVVSGEVRAAVHEAASEHARWLATRWSAPPDGAPAEPYRDPRPGLLAIDRLAAERRRKRFDELQERWLGHKAEGLRRDLGDAAERLAARAGEGLETPEAGAPAELASPR
ncbi:MAG TPA: CHAD domain-containing protein [Myxococcaceae bacterium]|nr:CHAD domain-containing protein [Myxococcaceae bacterium]